MKIAAMRWMISGLCLVAAIAVSATSAGQTKGWREIEEETKDWSYIEHLTDEAAIRIGCLALAVNAKDQGMTDQIMRSIDSYETKIGHLVTEFVLKWADKKSTDSGAATFTNWRRVMYRLEREVNSVLSNKDVGFCRMAAMP